MTKYYNQRYRVLLCTFIRTLSYFLQDGLQNAPDYFRIFSGLFENISRNVWRHSPECLRIFPGIFGDIPRNVWGHFPDCLATFPKMFEDISLTECLAIFRRIFGDILWNITFSHSPLSSYSITRSCIPGFIYSPPCTAGNPNIPSGDSNTIKSIIEEYKYHSRIINIRNQTNLNVNTFDFPHGTVEEIKLLKT